METFDANVLIQLLIEENSIFVSKANIGLLVHVCHARNVYSMFKHKMSTWHLQIQSWKLRSLIDYRQIFTNFNNFLNGKMREFLRI